MSRLYGVGLLRSALLPFVDEEGRFELENLKILLTSMEIAHDTSEMNEFRYFLANLGILVMKVFIPNIYP
jgi:hypothetical protein